jgi:hypothetical protein
MKTYIAKWFGQESFMVFRAEDQSEVFDALDHVGDPAGAEIKELPEGFILSFSGGVSLEGEPWDFDDLPNFNLDTKKAFREMYGGELTEEIGKAMGISS